MSAIHDNTAALEATRASVAAHPMCLRLLDERPYFVIVYPQGDFPVDGLRVGRTAAGLRAALEKMEKHWAESYP